MTRVVIDSFHHRPGGHCSSTALRDLLDFHGHVLTEDMVFGLGVGAGFVYYHNPSMNPPVYIGGRIYNLEEHLCSHLGIGMEVVSGLEGEDAWLGVKELLDRGIPTMVHADVYYLDYLKAKVHFSGHRVVLVGYDDEAGIAYVADNDREAVQECSLESLARARSSSSLPQPADNTFYRFQVPERLNDRGAAIKTAIEKAVKYNLRLPPDNASFDFQNAFVCRGILGLERFAEEMSRWGDEMDEETLTLLCKSIYVTAEKAGTGYGGNFRRMYGRFLKESAGVLSLAALYELGEEFVSIGDKWTELCLIFKELSARGAEATEAAQPLAFEICSREKGAFSSLEDLASSWR